MELLRKIAKEMGLKGLTITVAIACVFGTITFNVVVDPAVEELNVPILDQDSNIPPELADHATRGDMERGGTLGATPNRALPRPDGIGLNYQWKGSPNFSSRGACGPQAIVLHVTGPGSMSGMASWFNNPSSQVSAHFGIGKNGEVHQYVELADAAWHAGVFSRPDLGNSLVNHWYSSSINPNRCTIGIELLLAGPAEPLTEYPAMEESLTTLLNWLTTTFFIPVERSHILGHYQIDSINRATDPSCCVNFGRVLERLGTPREHPVFGACDPSWGGTYIKTLGWWTTQWSGVDPVTGVWEATPPCPAPQ